MVSIHLAMDKCIAKKRGKKTLLKKNLKLNEKMKLCSNVGTKKKKMEGGLKKVTKTSFLNTRYVEEPHKLVVNSNYFFWGGGNSGEV